MHTSLFEFIDLLSSVNARCKFVSLISNCVSFDNYFQNKGRDGPAIVVKCMMFDRLLSRDLENETSTIDQIYAKKKDVSSKWGQVDLAHMITAADVYEDMVEFAYVYTSFLWILQQ